MSQLMVDPSLNPTEKELKDGAKRYADWHWGDPARKVVDLNDPDMPRTLIECGRLIRLHVRAPRAGSKTNPRRVRDSMIEFSTSVSGNSHIAFDPDHSNDRLYLVIPPGARKVIKERFWDQNTADPMDLNDLAMAIGGRHGKRDYPNVTVRPIGICTAVVYRTTKTGDGNSYYIHRMAELSGHYAALAADAKGRLWLAGGKYTVPNPGITD